jgi:threonine/homoserine/homoserine lactone efflux protein
MKIFNTIMILGVALLAWIGASFVDIIEDNNTTAQHSKYNLICLINDIEG